MKEYIRNSYTYTLEIPEGKKVQDLVNYCKDKTGEQLLQEMHNACFSRKFLLLDESYEQLVRSGQFSSYGAVITDAWDVKKIKSAFTTFDNSEKSIKCIRDLYYNLQTFKINEEFKIDLTIENHIEFEDDRIRIEGNLKKIINTEAESINAKQLSNIDLLNIYIKNFIDIDEDNLTQNESQRKSRDTNDLYYLDFFMSSENWLTSYNRGVIRDTLYITDAQVIKLENAFCNLKRPDEINEFKLQIKQDKDFLNATGKDKIITAISNFSRKFNSRKHYNQKDISSYIELFNNLVQTRQSYLYNNIYRLFAQNAKMSKLTQDKSEIICHIFIDLNNDKPIEKDDIEKIKKDKEFLNSMDIDDKIKAIFNVCQKLKQEKNAAEEQLQSAQQVVTLTQQTVIQTAQPAASNTVEPNVCQKLKQEKNAAEEQLQSAQQVVTLTQQTVIQTAQPAASNTVEPIETLFTLFNHNINDKVGFTAKFQNRHAEAAKVYDILKSYAEKDTDNKLSKQQQDMLKNNKPFMDWICSLLPEFMQKAFGLQTHVERHKVSEFAKNNSVLSL